MSSEADSSHNVSITKQGIDARYDNNAVLFVKSVLEEVIATQVGEPLEPRFLSRFSRVLIKDGTRFDLPQRLKEHFPGFGGQVTSDAAACIQYEFDLKSQCLVDLDITSARRTDYQDAKEKVDDIQKGDLVIRDLGYFSSQVLKSIIKKEAFFLSRLKTKMLVFDESTQVNFEKLYQSMTRGKISRYHLNAYIGDKERIPVRMAVELVPEEVYQKRIRNVEKENKKNGRQTSNEFKARAWFNILVTNVPQDDLPAENMYTLYKTRWQIELIFKTWKSTMGINKIHPMKYQRLMCLLYAKFILFLINTNIICLINRVLYNKFDKVLSQNKCIKSLLLHFEEIRNIIGEHPYRLNHFIKNIYGLLSKNHWLEKRKNKEGFYEIFKLFTC
jgi:Transposase DDE domain